MAKIYSAPKEIKPAEFSFESRDDYQEATDQYVENVRKYVKSQSKSKLAGKIIRFAVADGYAEYMVLSMRPVELIHLDTYDGYHFQYVNRLTAKDVKDKLEQQEKFEKLFTKR